MMCMCACECYSCNMYGLLPAYEGGIVFTGKTQGREVPEGESSKYDTSRGRRVVTHLSPNKRSKMHGESRCFVLK